MSDSELSENPFLPAESIVNLQHQPERESENGITRDQILEALARAGGSKTKAAKALGIGRTTLWRKLKDNG